jgi:hypothetical protein
MISEEKPANQCRLFFSEGITEVKDRDAGMKKHILA